MRGYLKLCRCAPEKGAKGPAVAMLSDPMIESHKEFAQKIRAKGLRGESAYACVDGVHVHDIPAQACSGRAGTHGKTFTGYFDAVVGEIRFDCAEDPAFHLTIDLSKVPHFAAQPGGELYAEARASFASHAGGE